MTWLLITPFNTWFMICNFIRLGAKLANRQNWKCILRGFSCLQLRNQIWWLWTNLNDHDVRQKCFLKMEYHTTRRTVHLIIENRNRPYKERTVRYGYCQNFKKTTAAVSTSPGLYQIFQSFFGFRTISTNFTDVVGTAGLDCPRKVFNEDSIALTA